MDSTLLRDAMTILRERLPPGWRIEDKRPGERTSARAADAAATITDPAGEKGTFAIKGKTTVYPKDVLRFKDEPRLRTVRPTGRSGPPLLVVSPFLTKSTRQALLTAGFNWVDLTGNVRLVLRRPGLYVETHGANRRLGGERGLARTLKGRNAGRLVRVLLAADRPVGVVELAERAGTDPGYTSRVLKFLENEALIERKRRGPVTRVDRAMLTRRWAEDAPLPLRARVEAYFEPRGLGALIEKLRDSDLRYAVTGSLAAQRWAPVAPPRLAQVYVSNPKAAARLLDLRPASGAANVQLLHPTDPDVLESASKGPDGVFYAKPLQVVADLLTGPGRSPAEGEELLTWMDGQPGAWS